MDLMRTQSEGLKVINEKLDQQKKMFDKHFAKQNEILTKQNEMFAKQNENFAKRFDKLNEKLDSNHEEIMQHMNEQFTLLSLIHI